MGSVMSPRTEAGGAGPLAGYRVIELAAWVAGPSAAGLLADWGADVIKVEPPAGDPQRRVFGAVGIREQIGVPPFEVDNRGKRSVVLDLQLKGSSGIDVLRSLRNAASTVTVIVLTNYATAAYRKRCLDSGAHFFLDKTNEFESLPGIFEQLKSAHT